MPGAVLRRSLPETSTRRVHRRATGSRKEVRRMRLLTHALRRTIPPLYSQEQEADPICQVRLFMPDGAFT